MPHATTYRRRLSLPRPLLLGLVLLLPLLARGAPPPPPASASRPSVDRDNSGTISADELSAAADGRLNDDEIHHALRLLDADDKGGLDPAEVRAGMLRFGTWEKLQAKLGVLKQRAVAKLLKRDFVQDAARLEANNQTDWKVSEASVGWGWA